MKNKITTIKFDELSKGLVQTARKRQALKRFCIGLAGMALVLCLGAQTVTPPMTPSDRSRQVQQHPMRHPDHGIRKALP